MKANKDFVSMQQVLGIKKKLRYSVLHEKRNPFTGQTEILAILDSKQRKGCEFNLIISIGKIRPFRPVSIIRRKPAK